MMMNLTSTDKKKKPKSQHTLISNSPIHTKLLSIFINQYTFHMRLLTDFNCKDVRRHNMKGKQVIL
jgi:bacterioferritin (cytochrome b1)